MRRRARGWRRPRYRVHFTPTYASWLDQVERWFGHITERAIRRGSFRFAFAWTATADSIYATLERLLEVMSGTAR